MPYSVYVIRLKPEVFKVRRNASRNPDRRSDKPCLYVGSSVLTPEERCEQHRIGLILSGSE
jgi:hypothetical protein